MTNNKLMLLMTALIGMNTSMMMGAEVSEKDALTRTVCTKMVNLYKYNKIRYGIDQSDLKLFLEYNNIQSVDDLIVILEHGKELLKQDIFAVKTEGDTSDPYLLGLVAGVIGHCFGLAGHDIEDRRYLAAEYSYYWRNRSYQKDFCDASFNKTPQYCTDGKFDGNKFKSYHSEPVYTQYIKQNMSLYTSLRIVGTIVASVSLYKLYNICMFARNKHKEIATFDTIIEQIKLIQQNEVQ